MTRIVAECLTCGQRDPARRLPKGKGKPVTADIERFCRAARHDVRLVDSFLKKPLRKARALQVAEYECWTCCAGDVRPVPATQGPCKHHPGSAFRCLKCLQEEV